MNRPVPPSSDRPDLAEQLEPVRRSLLDDANADAQRLRDDAGADAGRTIAQAEEDADAEVEEVQRRSAIANRAHADQERARARADGHNRVLAARERIHQQLRTSVREAARQLRSDPRYPALLDHYEARALADLGPTAHVDRDPDPAGGIVATAGQRRVDYSLDALADLAVDALADEVATLWQ